MIGVEKTFQFSGHIGSIYALCNGEKSTIYSGSGDGILVQWNYETFEPGKGIAKVDGHIYSLFFEQQKNIIGIGQSLGGVHWLDLETKKEIRFWKSHESGIFDIQKCPTMPLFIITSADGSISFYDADTLAPIYTLKVCKDKIRKVSCHPTLALAALACSDSYVRIVNLNTLRVINEFKAHDWACNTVLWKSDVELISGSRDAHLKIWNFNDNQLTEIRSIPAHNYAIYHIEKHPQKDIFATASRDKNAKLWSYDFEILLRIDKKKYDGHINSVNTLTWTQNGEYLVTAGDDKTIMFWKLTY